MQTYILGLPAEVILRILSYLDLPDLAALAHASPLIASLTADPILHRERVTVTAPSRVNHALFGVSPGGAAFRPTVGDLVQRGVIRGLAIERQWRMGAYLYSRNSIIQYETGLRLARRHIAHVISMQLRRRSPHDKFLDSISHVLPNVECASHTISRTLHPAIHRLKWSIQRDKLAKMVRLGLSVTGADSATFGSWCERKGSGVIRDVERNQLLSRACDSVAARLNCVLSTMALVSSLLIEVCVDSVRSAIIAAQAGADRLELCANLGVGGGTTPSLGLLRSVQNAVNIPIMVMIRPRTGDFLYSDEEVEVMLEDIRVFKEHNVRGIVVGMLDKDGRVDVERMKCIVDEALPIEVCFHRAFDMTREADEALRDIESIGGISRILTSGQGKTALEALPTIESLFNTTKELIDDEPWGLTILPGSGINPTSIDSVLDRLLPLGLQEIHMSGSRWVEGDMSFRREGMGMGIGDEGEWGVWVVDGEKVSEVRGIADERWDAHVLSRDGVK
ncbi:hypothetical protein H0H92_002140 [Tricholoma furcatifolium]|nr:hypothetical protein H0H92_002140 [Tricholoma furcatifolium]